MTHPYPLLRPLKHSRQDLLSIWCHRYLIVKCLRKTWILWTQAAIIDRTKIGCSLFKKPPTWRTWRFNGSTGISNNLYILSRIYQGLDLLNFSGLEVVRFLHIVISTFKSTKKPKSYRQGKKPHALFLQYFVALSINSSANDCKDWERALATYDDS